jgi:hypothetical protein
MKGRHNITFVIGNCVERVERIKQCRTVPSRQMTLYQRWNNVIPWRWYNVGNTLDMKVEMTSKLQRWNNVRISTLEQHHILTLIQRWKYVGYESWNDVKISTLKQRQNFNIETTSYPDVDKTLKIFWIWKLKKMMANLESIYSSWWSMNIPPQYILQI